ncbi:diiron oxygenase [Tsukamurella sp. 8F]|uniref:AurF N-oxygenase family protein n=1 Tax=unclassified Tsukamurella TaxID=2633480 RepID=UPI0023B8F7F6|nr:MULTISPECIES: diiron oxygenase [unclassified Tsukamurella]MDF0531823.1 diiron oxygenase [Tsukamurella sp. 8J]MDF0589099.1 diiron oxygenase [Tsukamurella sp. 8F]
MRNRRAPGQDEYEQNLRDLSDASVHRNFDPYIDIDWDSPELAVTPNDPRWILSDRIDPIGRTEWYKSLPAEKQIRMGMWRQANVAKVGLQFESVLIRGLMQYTAAQPNGSVEFRYATHEAKEECQHTLMFQEFVNRIGADVPGGQWWFRRLSILIPLAATTFPTIFYMGVLGGEEPIDHIQKQFLRSTEGQHPTMTAVMQLHVAEEARHISFAHQRLEQVVPTRGPLPKFMLSLALPIVMRVLLTAIAVPPKEFRREFDIPREVWREMYWRSPESREMKRDVFGDVRLLAKRTGLMNPLSRVVWRLLGIDGRASRFRSEPSYAAA